MWGKPLYIKGLLLINKMLFPVILDNFVVPVLPWDFWLDRRIAITLEVQNTEIKTQDMTIEEHIAHYAKKNWVDTKLVTKIIKCESWFHVYAKNKTSSARWLGQFLTQDFQRTDGSRHISTRTSSSKRYLWYKWDVYNVDHHLDVMTKKIANEWTGARNASKHCWTK